MNVMRNLALAFDLIGMAILMKNTGWYAWEWNKDYLIHDSIEGARNINSLSYPIFVDHYSRWAREDAIRSYRDSACS